MMPTYLEPAGAAVNGTSRIVAVLRMLALATLLGLAACLVIFGFKHSNLPPNAAGVRESSTATNFYLVSFTVQTEGGGFMTGDISFASDLKTLRDVDRLRGYIAAHIADRQPRPINAPTILNIVKL